MDPANAAAWTALLGVLCKLSCVGRAGTEMAFTSPQAAVCAAVLVDLAVLQFIVSTKARLLWVKQQQQPDVVVDAASVRLRLP